MKIIGFKTGGMIGNLNNRNRRDDKGIIFVETEGMYKCFENDKISKTWLFNYNAEVATTVLGLHVCLIDYNWKLVTNVFAG